MYFLKDHTLSTSTALFSTVNRVKRNASAFTWLAFRPRSIRHRIALLVIALMVPMNALVVGAIVNLANKSHEAQYSELRYTARAVANSLEAQLQRYLAIARALSASTSLLEEDLSAFRAQA